MSNTDIQKIVHVGNGMRGLILSRLSNDTRTDAARKDHLLFMVESLSHMEDVAKANRWLGFIQGVLVARELSTVKELSEINAEVFKK